MSAFIKATFAELAPFLVDSATARCRSGRATKAPMIDGWQARSSARPLLALSRPETGG